MTFNDLCVIHDTLKDAVEDRERIYQNAIKSLEDFKHEHPKAIIPNDIMKIRGEAMKQANITRSAYTHFVNTNWVESVHES